MAKEKPFDFETEFKNKYLKLAPNERHLMMFITAAFIGIKAKKPGIAITECKKETILNGKTTKVIIYTVEIPDEGDSDGGN